MSDNAPCTHRRKRRLGCQTKKCSDAPAAVKRFLTSGLFLTCRIDRLIPLAALALVTCIATILSPENGPLFMVAGDPNATVGGTIGFVGDAIVPGRVAESVLRASLVYTIVWIPAATIAGVTAVNATVGGTIGFVGDAIVPGRVAESVLRASLVYTIVWIPAATIAGVTAVGIGTAETTAQLSQAKGVPGGAVGLARVIPQTIALWIPAATIAGVTAVGIGTAETTAQLSQAKGVPGGAVGLARVIPQTIALSLAYFLSCTGAFILKTLTYGPPLTEAAWGTALAITLTNCLLLCAIHTMSALIAAVCRMPLLALFLSLLLSIGPLPAYPRAYIAGSTPMAAWMNPPVWLMHTCSLNAPGALPVMSAAVGAGICVIASVLTYAICNCQEACR